MHCSKLALGDDWCQAFLPMFLKTRCEGRMPSGSSGCRHGMHMEADAGTRVKKIREFWMDEQTDPPTHELSVAEL
jgi:hypothetical protein